MSSASPRRGVRSFVAGMVTSHCRFGRRGRTRSVIGSRYRRVVSHVVDEPFDSLAPRALPGAVDEVFVLHAVTDDPAVAARAARRQRVDRALERVEDVMSPAMNHGKRVLVVVFADFTNGHDTLSDCR